MSAPSPWRVEIDDGDMAILGADYPDELGRIGLLNVYRHDWQDHARLISAAPELLEALAGLILHVRPGFHRDAYEKARAAIAKATSP